MYTLMIIDDEYDIRRALIETLDWPKLGFSIVGEAENGKEAMELVQSLNPDVVITDIKMPFISGIELTESIRETNPTTKVIFLTGFDDFQYALSAIKLSVFEYLLKPISQKNIIETMTNIRHRLDMENKQLQDIKLLREEYNQSISVVRLAMLIALISNAPAIKNLDIQAEKHGIRLEGETHLVFTIKIEKSSIVHSSLETDDIVLILISIRNLAANIIKKYMHGEVFIYDESITAIISDTEKSVNEYSHILINEIQQTVLKHYNILTAIGVSDPFTNLKGTSEAYQRTKFALQYRHEAGVNKIIHISDFEPNKTAVFIYDEHKEFKLQSIIKTGDIAELKKFIDAIFKGMTEKQISLSNCQICILEMFATLLKVVRAIMPDFNVNISNNLQFMAEMYKKDSLDEIKNWFFNICVRMIEYIALERRDSANLLANEGLNIIKTNYANTKISLKSVSGELFISPSYFSAIFKKEIGESFSDYLTRIRMEKAKELLLTTNLKIFEIGAKTGYADQHYFSYCFKKYYGQSPNEIRLNSQLHKPNKGWKADEII